MKVWIIFFKGSPFASYLSVTDAMSAFERLKLCSNEPVEVKCFMEAENEPND